MSRAGGPLTCLGPCSECDGEHHFSEAMVDFADENPAHEAAKAGCECWFVCKHCPAWREEL